MNEVMNPSGTITIGAFTVSDSALFVAGAILILCGTYMRWRLAFHVMESEERAKDGWLSEDQARRRQAVLRFGGPLMILLGTVAFLAVFWR